MIICYQREKNYVVHCNERLTELNYNKLGLNNIVFAFKFIYIEISKLEID